MNFIRSRHRIVKRIGKAQVGSPINQRLASPFSYPEPHSPSLGLMRSQVPAHSTAITSTNVVVTTASLPAPWLSGRSLDFCLLAVCSCVLAVLCHQTMPFPTNSGVSAPSAVSTSSASPNQLDFTLKAGLFTTSQQKDDQSDDHDEQTQKN